MLYREPKLLKALGHRGTQKRDISVSVLYREPKLLKVPPLADGVEPNTVSVLYREPKLLKVIN